MLKADFNKNDKVAWCRVLLGTVLVVVTMVSAMALMLFYRLAFLPAAISEF